MAIVKFDKESFLESMEMGLPAYIVGQFQETLEKKLNNIVEETYEELKKELPNDIKARIQYALNPYCQEFNIKIEVDLGNSKPRKYEKE